MKKLLVFMCILVLATCFSSCGENKKKKKKTESKTAISDIKEIDYYIGDKKIAVKNNSQIKKITDFFNDLTFTDGKKVDNDKIKYGFLHVVFITSNNKELNIGLTNEEISWIDGKLYKTNNKVFDKVQELLEYNKNK